MGKDGGFMTAKAISKRIKAKGLGRLRWYCQMCEKQCRDENGFKCHTQSAGHQRQLALFSENPHEFIAKFSNAFRRDFLSILCQRYGTRMVNANTVYQEYIKDKQHIHMNATQWTTLTDFVKDLGKEGLCKVEDREDGFWVQFVDRELAQRDRLARERDTQLLEEEYRSERILQKQLQHAARVHASGHSNNSEYDDDHDLDDSPSQQQRSQQTLSVQAPLNFKLATNNTHRSFTKSAAKSLSSAQTRNALQSLSSFQNHHDNSENTCPTGKRKKSRWDIVASDVTPAITHATDIDPVQTAANGSNESTTPGGPWLAKNIVVKVKNAQVGNGSFAGKKGRVVDVIDEYGARVSIIDSGAVLELDQDDLETVIPKKGGIVAILTGPHKGKKATIQNINVDHFNVNVTLMDSGQHIQSLEYESVSRLYS